MPVGAILLIGTRKWLRVAVDHQQAVLGDGRPCA